MINGKVLRALFLLCLFMCRCPLLQAQRAFSDSLLRVISSPANDTTIVRTYCTLSSYYSFLNPDSAVYYAEKALTLSKQQQYAFGEVQSLLAKGEAFDRIAEYPTALQLAYNALEISQAMAYNAVEMTAKCYDLVAHLNGMMGNPKEAVRFFHTALSYFRQSGDQEVEVNHCYFQLAFVMMNLNNPDSAIYYITLGKPALNMIVEKRRDPTPWLISANIYNWMENTDSAENFARKGIAVSKQYNNVFLQSVLYNTMAFVFLQQKKRDSCIFYVHRSLDISTRNKYRLFEMESDGFLSDLYSTQNADSSLKYLRMMLAAKDGAFGESKLRQFQLVSFEDERRKKELDVAATRFKNQLRIYGLLAALLAIIVIAAIFRRNFREKQRSNLLLSEEKDKAESALAELKSTQAQLVQSEKMASLGQLTAGIAHEIQNPLNFVNNFSDVNTELIDEMTAELSAGNITDAMSIARDIKENEAKINLHGKRAGSIVKGMLQHSRNSTGQKELTDINALAEECLRLAYHGFRSTDKSVNISLQTSFDDTVGMFPVNSQDMGRVLLNLLNNAFYSMSEKMKLHPDHFQPVLSMVTKRLPGKITITLRDNGNGIPPDVLNKIFNPFFTTKPTGEGTGLGLSLSFEIISKGHGGELTATTQEGEYAEFVISLPVPVQAVPPENIHLS